MTSQRFQQQVMKDLKSIKRDISKLKEIFDEDRILTEEEKELLEQSHINEKNGNLKTHKEIMKILNK